MAKLLHSSLQTNFPYVDEKSEYQRRVLNFRSLKYAPPNILDFMNLCKKGENGKFFIICNRQGLNKGENALIGIIFYRIKID